MVNVKLKSGTNELHGTLFEFLQNDELNANRGRTTRTAKPRASYKQNQFGAAVGGPIIKNRLFIFGDYQGTRIASTGSSPEPRHGGNFTIPTPAMINGDFSRLLGDR